MLKKVSIKQLLDLKSVLNQIEVTDFNKSLIVLENGTIGKHVRHILEFYDCLLNPKNEEIICYDDRKRNLLLEENLRFATDYIDEIIDKINYSATNKKLLLKCVYGDADEVMETSFYREITYNIEHTVHHLAIIKIAVNTELIYIELDPKFGFADSTIQYLATQQEVSV